MKNLIFKLFFSFTVLFYSCSNEEVLNKETTNEIVELNSLSIDENQLLMIESGELPMLSNSQAKMIGYENLIIDIERTATLDTKSNVLSVPFNKKESIKSQLKDPAIGLCIRIQIARQNPSANCSGGCIECIGFACDFITFPCLINQKNSENPNRNPSQEREQTAEVIVNENNQVIEYQFYNKIDWKYLANN